MASRKPGIVSALSTAINIYFGIAPAAVVRRVKTIRVKADHRRHRHFGTPRDGPSPTTSRE
jgi:hypothetical protein